jgi:hypothetical protein
MVAANLYHSFALRCAVEHAAEYIMEYLNFVVEALPDALVSHLWLDDYGAQLPMRYAVNDREFVEGCEAYDFATVIHNDDVSTSSELVEEHSR